MYRTNNRRQFLIDATSLAASAYLFSQIARAQNTSRTRIILLGTKGGPTLGTSGRSNPSTLLLINDVPYVIDCGYGVSRQLIKAGVGLERLRYVFITHLHSDHDLEFGALFYNAWVAKQSPRVDAYGPVGLKKMARDFFSYMKFDIDTRIVDEGMTDPRVLIHEAMYLPAIEKLIQQNPGSTRLREHLLAAHTSTEDVGRIAAQAEVKTLVLTHFVPGDDPSITDEQWSEGVRKHFNGRIIVGKDLMEI
jgi:ribonuclease BN (tRNA processing enzyme)